VPRALHAYHVDSTVKSALFLITSEVSFKSRRGRNPSGPRRNRGTTKTTPFSAASLAVGVTFSTKSKINWYFLQNLISRDISLNNTTLIPIHGVPNIETKLKRKACQLQVKLSASI